MFTDNELVMDAGGSQNFCFEILHAKAFYFEVEVPAINQKISSFSSKITMAAVISPLVLFHYLPFGAAPVFVSK